MIEQGFNDTDSTIKEMTDFIETRVENLEPKEVGRNLQQLPRSSRDPSRRGKGMTPTPVSQSPAKNQLKLATLPESTTFYKENAVILQMIAMIYVLWSASTKTEKEETFQGLRKERQRIERSNKGRNFRNLSRTRKGGRRRRNCNTFVIGRCKS